MAFIVTCSAEHDLVQTTLKACLDLVSFGCSSPDFDTLNTFSLLSIHMNWDMFFFAPQDDVEFPEIFVLFFSSWNHRSIVLLDQVWSWSSVASVFLGRHEKLIREWSHCTLVKTPTVCIKFSTRTPLRAATFRDPCRNSRPWWPGRGATSISLRTGSFERMRFWEIQDGFQRKRRATEIQQMAWSSQVSGQALADLPAL